MKYILVLCFSFLVLQLTAQTGSEKKQSTVEFHIFYNDFATAQLMRTTSVNNVIKNKLWNRLSGMQMGLGLSYLKGITKNIDAIGTVDGSFIDYISQSGTPNGSSKFLLTAQAAANAKLLKDRYTIVPYITGGIGFSLYNGKAGFYIPAGIGLQFNIFKEAFVFTNAQYRIALTPDVNYHFNYNIGIGVGLPKKKAKEIKPPVPVDTVQKEVVTEKKPEPVEAKIPSKTIIITVTDEATGQPLPGAEVVLTGADGKTSNGITDKDGKISFNEITAADYTIAGSLNGINTSAQNISKNNFVTEGAAINIGITHNDPRFTLSGQVINKTTGRPEGLVDVTVTNETQSSITTQQSKPGDGSFKVQLESSSDFTIVGKKSSYLSNIEKASTKGLNRSTTLYLKLELDVQEVTASATIVLNKIYFETGKSTLNTTSSTDLNKVVQFLKDNPSLRLEIQGHTDNVGSAAINQTLSQNRANSVVAYLIKNGITKDRLIAKGYGSGNPVASNATAAGKAQNRRVEMKLIE